MNNYHFIKTSQKELAEQFRKCGYKELKKEGDLFVFINKSSDEIEKETPINFDKSKVIFTNALTI